MITVGEVLKNKREKLKKNLETVSLDTKIQKRFLEYIEKNEFSTFESEVFLTGFIKIYAKYLELDVNKVLALYRRTNPIVKQNKKTSYQHTFLKKKINIFTPQILITVLLIIFTVSVIGYIFFQIYKFQTPPTLNISEPQQDITTTEENISIKGLTDKNTVIEINDVVVDTNENGEFNKTIKLNEGINIVTIKAKKNTNNVLETVETRKITYTKETGMEIPEEEEQKENIIKLKVIDTSAWIKLDIDSENKLSQVVEPSETEYPIKTNLHIITGRLSSTQLYFNNKLIELNKSYNTGVAEILCTVIENEIDCE